MTKTTSLIVMLVSAMLVERIWKEEVIIYNIVWKRMSFLQILGEIQFKGKPYYCSVLSIFILTVSMNVVCVLTNADWWWKKATDISDIRNSLSSWHEVERCPWLSSDPESAYLNVEWTPGTWETTHLCQRHTTQNSIVPYYAQHNQLMWWTKIWKNKAHVKNIYSRVKNSETTGQKYFYIAFVLNVIIFSLLNIISV